MSQALTVSQVIQRKALEKQMCEVFVIKVTDQERGSVIAEACPRSLGTS